MRHGGDTGTTQGHQINKDHAGAKVGMRKVVRLYGLYPLVSLIAIIVMGFAWWFGLFDYERKTQPRQGAWPLSSFVRTVTTTSPNIEQVWSLSNIFTEMEDRAVFLSAIDDSVFFLGNMQPTGITKLIRLDIETGEVIWQRENDHDYIPMAFTTTSDNIFIGFFTGRIESYDVASGNRLWFTELPNTASFWERPTESRSITNVQHIVASLSHLYTSANRPEQGIVRLLEPSTGEVALTNSVLNGYLVVSIDENYLYTQSDIFSLQARDMVTGNVVWESAFEGDFYKQPAIAGDVVCVKTGLYAQLGWIYGINKDTGTILWRTEKNARSNVAANGKYVYYLTNEAQLQILNIETSELVGHADFSPINFEGEGFDRNWYDFYVVAKDDFILVYFADSYQLFAFRFLPVE
ncbi:MAG: PQQ-binding-like beta-propeller repeat protein [Anaerolineales bacterium]|nr:PQQ-binding-like beta-propeller repeat protein [Anaerolineales bacterium]